MFFREDYNQYRGKPNSDSFGFKLNSKGFKDVEYAESKAKGVYRIVGVGDSFTFGVPPYPYNFLTLLEDSLNATPSLPPVEVINMGISSTGPPHYLSLITEEVLKLKPDMIFLSFFVGNDINESSRDSRRRKVYTYSHLASALYYVYVLATGLSQSNLATTYGDGYTYCDTCSAFKPEKFLEIETQRSYIFRKNDSQFNNHAKDALSYLDQIEELCNRAGIKLVVALIPDEMQVNPALQRKVIKSSEINEADWDNTQPNRVISSKLRQKGIPVIDLLDEFVAHEKDTSLYIPNDSHWNILGNRLAATVLSQQLPSIVLNPQ